MRRVVTAACLVVTAAAIARATWSPPCDALARDRLGPAHRLDAPGPPIWVDGNGDAVLCFRATGMQGPLEGLVEVRDARVDQVILVRSREGLDRRALGPQHLAGYRDRDAAHVVVVDAVSGATVSSRLLMTAVNDRLGAWRTTTGRE